jgi:bacterioferritin-associated ferredoxin
MIVCVCHNVSDKAIRRALDEGAKSMEDIRQQLNVGSCCGKCNEFATTLVRAHAEDSKFNEVRLVIPA